MLLMVDFKVALTEGSMTAFCYEYKLEALNKEPTCVKNFMNPSCIGLYLTNCPKRFESTSRIETGFLDSHKFKVAVLKIKHEKVPL